MTESSARPPSGAGDDAPSRPHRAKRGEGDRLRDEILDATEQLLDETGDEAKISIRKVASRIGRTSPSIYLHFPDKASLMWAVCGRQFAEADGAMVAAVEGIDDPVERVTALARAYVEFAVGNPEQFRILFLSDRSKLGGASTVDDLGQTEGFALVVDSVRDAAAAGQIAVADELATVVDLWAAVHGIAALLVTRPDSGLPSPADWVDHMVGTLLDGLRPR